MCSTKNARAKDSKSVDNSVTDTNDEQSLAKEIKGLREEMTVCYRVTFLSPVRATRECVKLRIYETITRMSRKWRLELDMEGRGWGDRFRQT